MRWIISVLIAVLVAPGAGSQEVITHLVNPSHGPEWREWLQEMAVRFEEQSPGAKIRLLPVPSGYYDKLGAMIAAGQAPDITEVVAYAGVGFLQRGVFLDLGPFIDADPQVSRDLFVPLALSSYTWTDGDREVIFGLPASMWVMGTAYNRMLFEAAGLLTPTQLGDGWTWDALLDAAIKLTRDTSGDGAVDQWGLQIGYGWGYSPYHRWSNQVHQAGGMMLSAYKDPAESRFNTPEVQTALRFVTDMWLKYDVDGSPGFARTGKVGINLTGGATQVVTLPRALPDLSFGYHFQPRGPVRGGTDVSANGLQISALTRHPQLAWQWVKFLTTDSEAARAHIRTTGQVPALTDLLPHWAELVESDEVTASIWYSIALDPDNRIRYIAREGLQIASLVNEMFRRVGRGERSVVDGLWELHHQVNQVLAQARENEYR